MVYQILAHPGRQESVFCVTPIVLLDILGLVLIAIRPAQLDSPTTDYSAVWVSTGEALAILSSLGGNVPMTH